MRSKAYPSKFWQLAVALASVSLLVTACAHTQAAKHTQVSKDPPLEAGWTWYHDSHFSFQMPVPPGWRAGAWDWDQNLNNWPSMHTVDLIPPPWSSTVKPGLGLDEHLPELIELTVMAYSPGKGYAVEVDQHFKLDPQPVTVSGTQARVYNNYEAKNLGYLSRCTATHFGAYQYLFYFSYGPSPNTPTEKMQGQIALYTEILQGFKYTG